MMHSDLQILQLLRLVSPALPVGAFAYSQGLEGGVEQAWIKDEDDSLQWISGVLQNSIAGLDLPALYWQLEYLQNEDLQRFLEFNDTVFAYRETAEFRLESHQMGQALMRLLRDTHQHNCDGGVLNSDSSQVLNTLLYERDFQHIDWVSAFAIAAFSVNLDKQKTLLGYAWSWSETQVAAAITLVP
jgi:urease accessory protein